MIRRDDVYKIGKLGKPHGVKGEITFAITDDVFDRVDADYLILDIDGILVPFYIEEYRFKNDENVLVKFEDIDTQEQVRAYTGCEVFFPRHLSDSDEENMSWAEIIGFQLVDATTGLTSFTRWMPGSVSSRCSCPRESSSWIEWRRKATKQICYPLALANKLSDWAEDFSQLRK